MLPPLVRGEVPPGTRIRRLTEQIEGARTGRGLGGVVADLWYAVTVTAALAAVAYGTAEVVREVAVRRTPEGLAIGEAGVVLVVLAVAGGMLALGARLGPVALGGGAAGWWLPMPVDRRGLLRPSVLRWPALGLAVGAVAAPLAALCFGMPGTLGAVLGWAGLGGGVTALVAAGAALVQQAPRAARTRARTGAGPAVGAGAGPGGREHLRREQALAATGDALVAVAVAGIAVLLATGGWEGWHLHRGGWVAAPLLLAAGALTLLADRGSERLDGAGLRRLGALGERAQVAVLALDMRELGRALTAVDTRDRRRPWRLRARGPMSAVAVADLTLLLRTPRALVQVVLLALIAVVTARSALVGPGIVLYPVLVLTGFWAANAAAQGARHAELVPALDRTLPLSARWARVAHGVAPLTAAAVWSAAAVATVPGLGPVAPAWALVLAAAAVRAAYRPPPKYRMPAVSTPMGGVPPTTGMTQGVDVVLVGTLPTALALYVGVTTPILVAVQWGVALALVAALVAASGRRPKP